MVLVQTEVVDKMVDCSSASIASEDDAVIFRRIHCISNDEPVERWEIIVDAVVKRGREIKVICRHLASSLKCVDCLEV